VTSKRLYQRELLFFLITGTVEGMLTALTLVTGKMLRPDEIITGDLALRIGLAAGFPTIVVFLPPNTHARDRNYCAWLTS
jgi:hypothetical protein